MLGKWYVRVPSLGSMLGDTDGSHDSPCSQEAHSLARESGDYTSKMLGELPGGGMPRLNENPVCVGPMKQDCSDDSVNPRDPEAGE